MKKICSISVCMLMFATILFLSGMVTALEDVILPEWQNQGQNKSTIRPGESISLYAEGRDDVVLNYAWLATNETGEWHSFTAYPGWGYCKEITIDHTLVEADLTNFPVLIAHTSSDFIYHAQPDGGDFIFVDSRNATQYNHEIDYYDSSTGELVAWVNIPFLSSTEDTVLYVYYGNPDCENQENIEATWNSDFLMVHHMTGASSTELDDSTANHWDVTSKGGDPTYNQVGKVGRCVDFDGSGDYLKTSDFRLPTDSSYTGCAWVYVDGNAGFRRYAFEGDSDYGISLLVWHNERFQSYAHASGGTAYCYANTTVDVGDPEWFYICTRADAGNDRLDVFVNSVSEDGEGSNRGISGTVNPETEGLNIGTYRDNTGYWMNGKIDEIRISNVARSDSWIKTEYNNMVSPSAFAIVGSEEIPTGRGPYGSPMKMQENDQWQWSNFTWQNPDISNGTVVDWRIYYNDTSDNEAATDIMSFAIIETPPSTPQQPSGPSIGYVGEEYTFTANSVTDVDNDDVACLFDWGNENQSGWTDFSSSGSDVSLSYAWVTEGFFEIKVKAKDTYGAESGWSSATSITITQPPIPKLVIDVPSSVVEGTSFDVTITANDITVENASVEFHRRTYYTDSNGIVNLTAPWVVCDNDYTITASHENYESASVTITVLNQEEQEIDKGWIYGWVSDVSGENIEGATVNVRISSDTTLEKLTNAQGYRILVPIGTYTVEVSKQGYTSFSSEITVYKNQASEGNFVIEKIVDYEPEPLAVDESSDIIEAVIDAAVSAEKVGGEIDFELSTEWYNIILYEEELNVKIISINESRVSFKIGAEGVSGTIIALRLFGEKSFSDISVEYDGESVDRIGFTDIFNLVEGNVSRAKYTRLLAEGENGKVAYCLVYIPSFSEHEITVYTFAAEALGVITAAVLYIAICVVGASAFIFPVFAGTLRLRKKKKL